MNKLKAFYKLHKKSLSVLLIFFLPTILAGDTWITNPKIAGVKNNYHIIWWSLLILFILYILFLFFFDARTKILLNFNGKKLSIQDIQKIKHIKKVVFIGLNDVGKTTLINSIFNEKYSNARTQAIIGRIKLFDNGKYICFIDVSGENKEQHYTGIKHSDLVVFMMDHSSRNSVNFNKKRQSDTLHYIEMIECYVISEELTNKPFLFIVNKKDLWSKSQKDTEGHISVIEKKLSNFLDKKPKKIEYSNNNAYLGDTSLQEIINKIIYLLNEKN